nr:Chain C, Spike protein S2' peptide VLNDILSRL [Severe acute respiratory syndrome coronavirus 2]
VLNDILSRL